MDEDHYTALDGGILTGSIHKSVAEEVTRFEEHVGDAWTRDFTVLADGIRGMCPDWTDHRETLLDNSELVQLMLSNKHYKKIGGLAGEIQEALRHLKVLHADDRGRVVSKEIADQAKNAATFGIETVAYTYMAHHLLAVFPSILDLQTMATRVAEVKYQIEHSHKVKLTGQMQKWCDEYVEGSRKAAGSAEHVLYSVPAPSVPAVEIPEAAVEDQATSETTGSSKRRRLSDHLGKRRQR